MQQKKIASFTGLRFIMIMFIVNTHFDGLIQHLGHYGELQYKYTFHFFMIAVDFFFLLSGFGMMLGNLNRISNDDLQCPSLKNAIQYAIKHVKKIYPVYIGTIIFGLIIVFLKTFNFITGKDIIKEFLKLAVNILLLQSATGMTFFTHAYNGAAWFLSSLFCIYILSPHIMYLLRKKSKNCYVDIIFIIINIVFIVILNHLFTILENKFHGIKGIPDIDGLVYMSPYKRIFYVIIGMNVAMLVNHLNINTIVTRKTASILETLIVIIALVYYSLLRFYLAQYFYSTIIEMIIVVAFLFIFSLDKGYISSFLGKPVMQTLGNMSMYIFLIHFAIIHQFMDVVYNHWGWTFASVFIFIAIILGVTFPLSYFLYKRDINKQKA